MSLHRVLRSSSSALLKRTLSTSSRSTEQSAQEKPPHVFSLEEALFLAKEAGIFTREEVQKQIMRSPSFSPDNNPILIENFYDAHGGEERNEIDAALIPDVEGEGEDDMMMESADASGETERGGHVGHSSAELLSANDVIQRTISKTFNPAWTKTFLHIAEGKPLREYRLEAEGRGSRKRTVAHVIIRRGSGEVIVEDKRTKKPIPFYQRWVYYFNRMDVLSPLYLTGTCGVFDVFIDVRGRGRSAQALAIRLALGRALVEACPSCAEDMEESLVLYEDTRQKWPHMPGRKKSRKQKHWRGR